MRAPKATMLARRRCGCSSHRPLAPVPLFLLSRLHSTALPSPERYGKRYELGCCANFLELRVCELRRIPIPRTLVNKAKKRGRSCFAPALAGYYLRTRERTRGTPRSGKTLHVNYAAAA